MPYVQTYISSIEVLDSNNDWAKCNKSLMILEA